MRKKFIQDKNLVNQNLNHADKTNAILELDNKDCISQIVNNLINRTKYAALDKDL